VRYVLATHCSSFTVAKAVVYTLGEVEEAVTNAGSIHVLPLWLIQFMKVIIMFLCLHPCLKEDSLTS
jgi:hypothetical protein